MNPRFAILLLIAVLAVIIVPSSPAYALSPTDLPDPCGSTATSAAGVHFICPQGDGDALSAAGLTITVTVLDIAHVPVPGIPAQDIWLIGCNDLLVLCGGSGAINATAPTDTNGMTTIEGAIAGGGCDPGVRVVVQGIVIGGGVCSGGCLPIQVRSHFC